MDWNGLLKEIIEGRIVGKRPRGRKRAMMLDDMKEGKELYAEMKERARHMENWRTYKCKCLEPAGRQETNDDERIWQLATFL